MEQILKAKVVGRTLAVEEMRARMGCGKTESINNECDLTDCTVCNVDATVEYFDKHLEDFCSVNREFDAFERGVGLFEDCCLVGKKEPSILITNKKWIDGMTKILMESIRQVLEVYGTTGELNGGEFQKMLGMLDYTYERVGNNSKSMNAKYSFEILNENPDEETPLRLLPIQDFFSEEEIEEHMASLSMDFRVVYGLKQIPSKASEWDGRVCTAEGVVKNRPQDVFLVQIPHGRIIGKQILSAGLFNAEGGVYYGMQPDDIDWNNRDPLFHMIPNRRSIGERLIIV